MLGWGRFTGRAGWSPYRGRTLTVRVRDVFLRGRRTVADGRVVAESGAIIEYLLERHDAGGTLSPARDDEDERLRYRYWMHYAEGSAMPPMVMALVFARIRKAPMPF